MRLKELLKRNHILRGFVKKIKNYREFIADAKEFSNNYEEVTEKRGDYRYRLLLYIHNLEKGMCRDNPRPFGKEKVEAIINILKCASEEEIKQFEYQLAVSVLKSWRCFYKEKGWDVEISLSDYINNLSESQIRAGYETYFRPGLEGNTFENIIFSRRSVRDFDVAILKQEDIDFAIKCFLAAPTACNRQMCKIYRVENEMHKQLLSEKILGISGFNVNTTNLFLITYDISALEFYGERNQGYVNVGLTAMNFANGLHARGIGSCFMQWSNNTNDDVIVRKRLGIPKCERIGLVVGAGYYKKETNIPCSTRKEIKDVYRIL